MGGRDARRQTSRRAAPCVLRGLPWHRVLLAAASVCLLLVCVLLFVSSILWYGDDEGDAWHAPCVLLDTVDALPEAARALRTRVAIFVLVSAASYDARFLSASRTWVRDAHALGVRVVAYASAADGDYLRARIVPPTALVLLDARSSYPPYDVRVRSYEMWARYAVQHAGVEFVVHADDDTYIDVGRLLVMLSDMRDGVAVTGIVLACPLGAGAMGAPPLAFVSGQLIVYRASVWRRAAGFLSQAGGLSSLQALRTRFLQSYGAGCQGDDSLMSWLLHESLGVAPASLGDAFPRWRMPHTAVAHASPDAYYERGSLRKFSRCTQRDTVAWHKVTGACFDAVHTGWRMSRCLRLCPTSRVLDTHVLEPAARGDRMLGWSVQRPHCVDGARMAPGVDLVWSMRTMAPLRNHAAAAAASPPWLRGAVGELRVARWSVVERAGHGGCATLVERQQTLDPTWPWPPPSPVPCASTARARDLVVLIDSIAASRASFDELGVAVDAALALGPCVDVLVVAPVADSDAAGLAARGGSARVHVARSSSRANDTSALDVQLEQLQSSVARTRAYRFVAVCEVAQVHFRRSSAGDAESPGFFDALAQRSLDNAVVVVEANASAPDGTSLRDELRSVLDEGGSALVGERGIGMRLVRPRPLCAALVTGSRLAVLDYAAALGVLVRAAEARATPDVLHTLLALDLVQWLAFPHDVFVSHLEAGPFAEADAGSRNCVGEVRAASITRR